MYLFNYNYDLLGRLTNQNINNNYNTNYSYITRTYKTSTMIDKVDDNGTIYNYTYDKLGNITEIRKNNILTNKYYYDEYSELIKEDDLVNNVTKVYKYDNYGNILSKKTYTYNTSNLIKEDKYQYNNSNWQDLLTKFNNDSITYDGIGNPLSIGSKTLSWMNGRELATYSDGANSISYKYNLNGIRTSKIVNGIKTEYILEGNRIIFEDRNNNMIYYIYNGEEILGFVYKNKTYYYHKNIFGDIIGILDYNYKEIVSYEYDSWGALLNITDTSTINLGTINPFRYRSYYYDTETQLYYLNSRYYNPQVGRFINGDSGVTGQGSIGNNLFAYVNNNPINNIDTSGMWFEKTKKFLKTIKKGLKRESIKLASKSPKPALTITSAGVLTLLKDYPIAYKLFNKAIYRPNAKLNPDTEKRIQDALLNSDEFRKGVDSIIEENYKFNYNYTSDIESIAFNSGDLYYAFHNANIRVSCTWFRGYPTYLVTFSDMYDFTEYFDDPKTLGQYANNLGYEMQKRGQLHEYYINMTFEYR